MTPEFDGDLPDTVAAKRAELERTLDAIEDKLNIPKQAGILAQRVKVSYEDNPTPWVAGAAAGLAVLGGIIALVVRKSK